MRAALGSNGAWKRGKTQYEGIVAPPPAIVCSEPVNQIREMVVKWLLEPVYLYTWHH